MVVLFSFGKVFGKVRLSTQMQFNPDRRQIWVKARLEAGQFPAKDSQSSLNGIRRHTGEVRTLLNIG